MSKEYKYMLHGCIATMILISIGLITYVKVQLSRIEMNGLVFVPVGMLAYQNPGDGKTLYTPVYHKIN